METIRPLKAVVVDEDPLGRARIRDLIAAHEDIRIAAECTSASDAMTAIGAHAPDVLFLDIELPHRSGFAILRHFEEGTQPAVVVVTRHPDFAVEAFELRAIDYLLKPVEQHRFEQSVRRARDHVIARTLTRACALGLRRSDARHRLERIGVKSASGIFFVRTSDIDWLETAGNYVRLHTGRESHLVRDTMGGMETQLDPLRFVRTHRTTIVNVERVVQLVPSFGREYVIVLRDGTHLKLGPQYRDNLRRLGFIF